MKTQVTVLRNNVVTIPRSTRDALGGIKEGDILDIDIEIAKRAMVINDKSITSTFTQRR